jgi:hypothetical protein
LIIRLFSPKIIRYEEKKEQERRSLAIVCGGTVGFYRLGSAVSDTDDE